MCQYLYNYKNNLIPTHTIVPQLSKCLKFETVSGVLTDQMIWSWTKRYKKTHACIVVHRMARHNHLTLFSMGGWGIMAPVQFFFNISRTTWAKTIKLSDF